MKSSIVFILAAMLLYACGQKTEGKTDAVGEASEAKPALAGYDPERGAGKFDNVELPEKLDTKMAGDGKSVYDLKCSGCHRLTDEKLVGPGWKGVSQKHRPEWIMNFITNPDVMIDKDPKVQAQLEICLIRMPNQNLSDDQARQLLEFMRQNDGVK